MIYAITYSALTEVTMALIPSSSQVRDFEFLTRHDMYDRIPLHWTVFYCASLESVIAITKASSSNELNCKDGNKNRVFGMVIKEGVPMDIVKELIPTGIDFDTATIIPDIYSCVFMLYLFGNSSSFYLKSDKEHRYPMTPLSLSILSAKLFYTTIREAVQFYIGGTC